MKKQIEGLSKFKAVLESMSTLPEKEWKYISKHLDFRVYDTGELLFCTGDFLNEIFFILDGIVRFYYLTEEGKEFIKHFAMENDFVGSFSSMVLKTPCRFSVQALEKTEVFALPLKIIEEGYQRHHAWERVGRKHAERIAVKKELRECEFLLDSAEVRYRRFRSEYPGLVNRIPQYHIASYLGITDVALSRIRNKIGLT